MRRLIMASIGYLQLHIVVYKWRERSREGGTEESKDTASLLVWLKLVVMDSDSSF